MEKDVFDLLVSFVTAKKSSYDKLPKSIQSLLIEKFDCKVEILQEIFPSFPFK
jgi:hypothetical protein